MIYTDFHVNGTNGILTHLHAYLHVFSYKIRSNLNIDIGTRVQNWLRRNKKNSRSEKKRRLTVSLSCQSYLLAGWLGMAWLGMA